MNAHVSGLFSVIGLVVYPVGWGTKRVRDLCGEYADPYVIDSCSIGEFCTIFEFYVIVSFTIGEFSTIGDFYVIVSCKKGEFYVIVIYIFRCHIEQLYLYF